MDAEGEPRTFFKLVGQQRKTSSQQMGTLHVNGTTCDTDQEICAGWATHFQSLATPLQNENFDADYKDQVDEDVDRTASSVILKTGELNVSQFKKLNRP